MSAVKIPVFEINGDGTPYETGLNYGNLLKDRIQSTIGIYHNWFINLLGGNELFIQKHCNEYEKLMKKECNNITLEIEGISVGSNVDKWKIYMLNCRTEIYHLLNTNNINIDECSGIISRSTCIIAQNWDWIKDMHDNVILLRIKRNNNSILMLIEPGMVGKIGMNSNGIGCTLMLLSPSISDNNFVVNNSKGIPIHVLMRLILESNNINNIDKILNNKSINTYSCLGIADNKNNAFYIEFCGKNKYEKLYASTKQFSFHTNHYLGCNLYYIGEEDASNSSLNRFKQLKLLSDNKYDNRFDCNCIKEYLTNDQNKDYPICRQFKYSHNDYQYIGTITTCIMNLKLKYIHISKGTPLKYNFKNVYVNTNNSIKSRL